MIVHVGIGETSLNGLLQVDMEHGDSAPSFSCLGEAVPTPTFTWGRQDGGGVALPSGVRTVMRDDDNVELVWSRSVDYADSGHYLCTAANSNGLSTATLDLLVRRESVAKASPPLLSNIMQRERERERERERV